MWFSYTNYCYYVLNAHTLSWCCISSAANKHEVVYMCCNHGDQQYAIHGSCYFRTYVRATARRYGYRPIRITASLTNCGPYRTHHRVACGAWCLRAPHVHRPCKLRLPAIFVYDNGPQTQTIHMLWWKSI